MKKYKKLLDTKEYLLIDVRTPEEYNEMRINYPSKNLPLDEINSWIKELDKNKKYIIYCRSGGRSSFACELLKKENFNVIDLEGGILAWKSRGGEVI